jgi:hypothetical protein
VAAVSIPLSLLVALIVLWQQNITLNILTLGEMTVAIGRVVDDAIVVLENISRHVSEAIPTTTPWRSRSTASTSPSASTRTGPGVGWTTWSSPPSTTSTGSTSAASTVRFGIMPPAEFDAAYYDRSQGEAAVELTAVTK